MNFYCDKNEIKAVTINNYSHNVLKKNIQALNNAYPFVETGIIGFSAAGRELFYIRLGDGDNRVLYIAAIHSLEWITTPVMMKFIEDYSRSYVTGTNISEYDTRRISDKSSIYIVPMVNPDGVELVQNGLNMGNPNCDNLKLWNNGSTDFRAWQANNNGVDLNHNFDADWEESKKAAEELGITEPGSTRYPGVFPECEPESKALADFTRSHDFKLVLAYHTQGEEIFWNFREYEPPESKEIGKELAKASGYCLAEPIGIASHGGFKDWFIKEFRRPGFTVEAGYGKNPLPVSCFGKIYSDNLPLLLRAAVL